MTIRISSPAAFLVAAVAFALGNPAEAQITDFGFKLSKAAWSTQSTTRVLDCSTADSSYKVTLPFDRVSDSSRKLVYSKVSLKTPSGDLAALFARANQKKPLSSDGKPFLLHNVLDRLGQHLKLTRSVDPIEFYFQWSATTETTVTAPALCKALEMSLWLANNVFKSSAAE